MIELNNKLDILELIGSKGKLNVVKSFKDKDGKIITQYEKNGYTFCVRI